MVNNIEVMEGKNYDLIMPIKRQNLRIVYSSSKGFDKKEELAKEVRSVIAKEN